MVFTRPPAWPAVRRAALRFLDLRYTVDQVSAAASEAGRLLIVANHPCGALDALALLDFVGRIRQDVRIVANDFLSNIGSGAATTAVRILGGRPQPGSACDRTGWRRASA